MLGLQVLERFLTGISCGHLLKLLGCLSNTWQEQESKNKEKDENEKDLFSHPLIFFETLIRWQKINLICWISALTDNRMVRSKLRNNNLITGTVIVKKPCLEFLFLSSCPKLMNPYVIPIKISQILSYVDVTGLITYIY